MKCPSLLAISVVIFVIIGTATTNAALFGGHYVGINLGYNVVELEVSSVTGRVNFLSASGINGGIFSGYGHRIGKFYIGSEAEVSWSDADHEMFLNDVGMLLAISQEAALSLSARIGVMLTDNTLAYVRCGWTQTWFSWKDANILQNDMAQKVRFPWKDTNGPRVGVGLEAAVTQRLTLRTDYTHTDYNVEYIDQVSYHPDERLFRVGLVLNF